MKLRTKIRKTNKAVKSFINQQQKKLQNTYEKT